MRLKNLEINSFKSFSKKTNLEFESPIVSVVGPNGSGKSNVVESIRFVLGEQSMKSMRGKSGLDFIFKGSKFLPKSSKASVSIYFDNSDKIFKLENDGGDNINLNYDTISISREVFADGLNKYILNGTEVRLKDINNLLASVNIGSSGHHIISQGEADRILNASPKDRREIVEDALGLKIYQFKIKESERKLERTNNNMKEISLLRRENAPHLNFLKKQVEKVEKAKEMKTELLSLYQEYLKKESIFLEKERLYLTEERNKITSELFVVREKIYDEVSNITEEENKKNQELKDLENKIADIRVIKNEIERKLGRIEGMLEMEERRYQTYKNREVKETEQENKVEEHSDTVLINKEELEVFLKETNEYLEEAIHIDIFENIAPILGKIKDILDRFMRVAIIEEKRQQPSIENKENINDTYDTTNLENLQNTQKDILSEVENINNEEKKIFELIQNLKTEIAKDTEASREKEREKFTFKVRFQELSSSLDIISVKESNLERQREAFENEIQEGAALIGSEIFSYKDFEVSETVEQTNQEESKRKIERIKIKLEDFGIGGSGDILKEFNEVLERDRFLGKEMEDLNSSIESLNKIIIDLKEKIDIEFQNGIKKINIEFQEFFALMFGGGTGAISVIENKKKKNDEDMETLDEEEVFDKGVEISVSLPHKKVKELHALSGGERSLTSIALLFAMSQVNPPPFLVLDETDAALDESNSRKYGDMLEKLSKHSQLIVVTHNRETMSRAGVLYGVTIGADGSSKLLSVKFDEATAIAK